MKSLTSGCVRPIASTREDRLWRRSVPPESELGELNCHRGMHVAVVDVPTRKIETYILVGKRSWCITLSKDESKLYVANGFGDDITIVDVKTRKATVSIPVGRIPWGVVIDE